MAIAETKKPGFLEKFTGVSWKIETIIAGLLLHAQNIAGAAVLGLAAIFDYAGEQYFKSRRLQNNPGT